MENNFDEEEKKYFTNGMILNKLGDTRDFGNFYELIHNRKLKVISFLNKDLGQISNPDLRQFGSLEHAYDVLLSFHIFYPYLYEDYMFMHSLETLNLEKDIENCLKEIQDINIDINGKEEHGLACELLLFHEQRKIRGIDEIEEEETYKKVGLTKKNMVIRLKTSMNLIDPEKGIRISGYKFIFKIPAE